MKVTAILKGMIDSNGHQPVQIRVNMGQVRKYYPTNIKVLPSQFDKGKIKNHPKAKELNQKITSLIYQYQASQLEKPKVPKVGLIEYIDLCINQWDRIKKDSTLKGLRSQREKIKEFSPHAKLSDINVTYLTNLQAHRFSKGNDWNTVRNTLRFVRMIVLKAISEGLLNEYPFGKGKFQLMAERQKPVEYLTLDEIEAIDKVCKKKNCPPELFFIGTWFLIACYTGLRYSDLHAFNKKKNIVGGRLIVNTVKTSETVSLPISERLWEYFERIHYAPLNYEGQAYNRLLKVLAMAAGIEKRVTSHTARHSAAMMMANSGISQEVAAKVLAHTDMKSTARYYKISNKRIDEELKKLR